MQPDDHCARPLGGRRRRPQRRSRAGGTPLATSALLMIAATAASPGETATASAFLPPGEPASRCRPAHHHGLRSPRQNRDRVATMRFSSSSSGDGGGFWSETFQNAVGTLDRRLEIEQGRRRREAAEEGIGTNGDGNSNVRFVSPLLDDGYPPAVMDAEDRLSGNLRPLKPMLLYLPGFDGTNLAPFLQFPSLSEEFDVRAMRVEMDDRSTFEELKDKVVTYVLSECRGDDGASDGGRGALYLMGESFGGILATEVALELESRQTYRDYIDLRGVVLVNPATCYLRSALYELGPPVANESSLPSPLSDVVYVFSLVTKLVPLFLDRGRAFDQLITILSSKGLPTVVNDPRREAYMGRVAFDLANRLKFMPKDTLGWRLEEWLEWGCGVFEDRLNMLRSARGEGESGDAETYALLRASQELRTLIVAGEHDLTLPSVEEANRLSNEVFRNARVHIVKGAGHASTCGGSLDLMGLMREAFPETNVYGYREDGDGRGRLSGGPREELHGLEPRYDGASIGLNPLLYWSKDYYRKWNR